MSRRRVISKRETLPDPKFGSQLLAKFINMVMVDGKKAVAEKILYEALERVSERTKGEPMEVLEKVRILAGAAKYDASCASSGSTRPNQRGGLGNAASSPVGICHSWAADGRCISLLKILYTNQCIHDCVYCVNRRSNDIPRASFTEDELIDLTIGFYRRNYIEGLFLSSGVIKSADYTMEILIRTIRRLRAERHEIFFR